MVYSKDYMPSLEEVQRVVNFGGMYWQNMLQRGRDLGMEHINTRLVTSIIDYLDEHEKLSPKQARVLIIMERSIQYRMEQQQ